MIASKALWQETTPKATSPPKPPRRSPAVDAADARPRFVRHRPKRDGLAAPAARRPPAGDGRRRLSGADAHALGYTGTREPRSPPPCRRTEGDAHGPGRHAAHHDGIRCEGPRGGDDAHHARSVPTLRVFARRRHHRAARDGGEHRNGAEHRLRRRAPVRHRRARAPSQKRHGRPSARRGRARARRARALGRDKQFWRVVPSTMRATSSPTAPS